MSSYWCELAWLGGTEPDSDVLIRCDGERITSVTVAASASADAVKLPGLTLPGLTNSHSHCFQRALRGRTQRAIGGSFWTWREQMYELAETLDAERFEALARATFAEMALAGITLVGEFDYLHHSDALIRAAADAGIRLTLIDACYLHGGLPRFRDASADAWAERVSRIEPREHVRLGAAIHSVRAVDPASAEAVAAFAAERRWPLHAHVSEQPAENEASIAEHGLTPLELLDRAGALSPRFTAVHATHFSDSDTERLRDAGGFCCICPTTERDLADGIGSAAGRLTLGSDSQAVIDIFEEARAVEMDCRLGTLMRGTYTALDLTCAATMNGYRSLGWPEGGLIEAGALADFVSIRLDGVRLAGTRPHDALDAVIFAATRDDVHTVIVGGQRLDLDPERVAADLQRAIPR
ncbi:MAG: formimidoylglutamate deiminase [Solirubrobacteraceae bacterium]